MITQSLEALSSVAFDKKVPLPGQYRSGNAWVELNQNSTEITLPSNAPSGGTKTWAPGA